MNSSGGIYFFYHDSFPGQAVSLLSRLQTHSSLDLAAEPRDVQVLRDPTHGGLATEIGGARILDLPFVERLPCIC